jgi:hypothetical protein
MPSSDNRTLQPGRPRPCGPARTPRPTAMLWIAVVGALALLPRADAADVVPIDLAPTLTYEVSDGGATGNATLAFLDGDVALDMVQDAACGCSSSSGRGRSNLASRSTSTPPLPRAGPST